ncbi:MAG: hypothetical protein AAFR79_17745 [Pseudomonadota bacterium]
MDINPSSLIGSGSFDRVVFHFDGNNNDPDDIAALPIAALIAKAAGIEDSTSFFYSNNRFEASVPWQAEAMEQAAAFAAGLGIDTRSYEDDAARTEDALVEMLDSGEQVLILEGGPMTATYDALQRVNPSNLSNITLVSHSVWNEAQGVPWSTLKAEFPDVTFIDIADRNGFTTPTTNVPGSGFKSKWWEWLDASDDPVIQQANAIMDLANGPEGPPATPEGMNPYYSDISYDASDAAMLLWALTETDPTARLDPREAQSFIKAGQSLAPEPDPVPEPLLTYDVHAVVDKRAVIEAEDGIRVLNDGRASWEKFADLWAVTTEFGGVEIEDISGDGVLWRNDTKDRILPAKNQSYLQKEWIHQTTPMAYTFTIEEGDPGGRYYVGIRMIKPEGQGVDHGDQGNDIYFASAAGGPILNNKTAISDVSTGGQLAWSKVFANGRGEETGFDGGGLDPLTWSWAIQEEGQHGSFLALDIPSGYVGEWTIYVAGRSQKVALDQIQVIHRSEADLGGKQHALNFDPSATSTKISDDLPTPPEPEPEPEPEPTPEPVPTPEPAPRLEMGTETVLQDDPDGWFSVKFAEAIPNAVVVMGPASWSHGDPIVPAVRNVTEDGFEFQLDEWAYQDGIRADVEAISWMAATAGAHALEDGTVIQAGSTVAGTWGPASVGFETAFETSPVVLSQAKAGADVTVTARNDDVTAEGFKVMLQEEDARLDNDLNALVDWIAVEATDSAAFDAGKKGAGFRWEQTGVEDFTWGDVFLADMQTIRDTEAATVRFTAKNGQALVRVHEDQSVDWEQNHKHERVGFIAGEADGYLLYDLATV